MAFIDDMRAEGRAVESTCRVLREQGCPVAARTYRAWKRGRLPAERTISDALLTDAILATGWRSAPLTGSWLIWAGTGFVAAKGSAPPFQPRMLAGRRIW